MQSALRCDATRRRLGHGHVRADVPNERYVAIGARTSALVLSMFLNVARAFGRHSAPGGGRVGRRQSELVQLSERGPRKLFPAPSFLSSLGSQYEREEKEKSRVAFLRARRLRCLLDGHLIGAGRQFQGPSAGGK